MSSSRMKRRGQHTDTSKAELNAHEKDPDPHPQYLLPEELPQTVVSWFGNQVDGPTGYFLLENVEPSQPEQQLSYTFGGVDNLLQEWIGQPQAQDVNYFQVSMSTIFEYQISGGGTQDAELYISVYALETDGTTERFLGTSGAEVIIETPGRDQVVISTVFPAADILVGERFIIKLFASEIGGGPNPTLDLFIYGLNVSRNLVAIPIPAFPAPHATSHHESGTEPGEPNNGSDEVDVRLLKGMPLDRDWSDNIGHSLFVGAPDRLVLFNVLQWIADNFAVAQYLALIQDSPGPLSLGGGFTKIDWWTTEFTPRGIVWDDVNHQLSFAYEGVYRISIFLNFDHGESNQGRDSNVRFTNVTDGTNEDIPFFIGRNQPGTSISFSFLTNISAADVGDLYEVYVGGGDSITGITWNATDLDINMVSEWKEPLPV